MNDFFDEPTMREVKRLAIDKRFVTGHQHGPDTSDRHYARVGDQMRAKFESLPVPEVFRNGPASDSE